MSKSRVKSRWARAAVPIVAAAAALVAYGAFRPGGFPVAKTTSVIVQARDMAAAAAAVRQAGGLVTHELSIIGAVGASLTAEQAERLRAAGPAVRVLEDRALRVAGQQGPPTYFPTLVCASGLHTEGTTGKGVTVAVLDSGWTDSDGVGKDTNTQDRVLQGYNAIANSIGPSKPKDGNGHGSHVLSLAVSSNFATDDENNRTYNGIAPDAKVVVVQAFDRNGVGTYANVIRGIDWVVANKAAYGIRVLNCSFSAPVNSWYWVDPLNQAIMKAWQAGIVVVASAGNDGPSAMSIGVPGNVPYVITVGAMTDHYTPADPNDDQLASFSATGPTYEGFVKPDLVAPGGHMVGLMSHDNVISRAHPSFRIQYSADKYFRMSGTSQSAAVVSGIAALMLQANPALTPDDVKCGLTATAGAEWSVSGPYTVFQQGAGLVNAYSAVHSGLTRCANTGLNIAMDLAGNHFGGPAGQDGRGNFFLMDGSATDTAENGGHGNVGAHPWTSGYGWSNGYPWSSGLVEAASVNVWVDQE